MLVDSHCHLDLLTLKADEKIADVVARANQQEVAYLLNVCVTLADFPKVLATANQFECVGASVGLHPNELAEEISVEALVKLGEPKKVIAIGETGLDYYRTEAETSWQSERFRYHIAAAKLLKKPLIIHTRQAKADTIQIMHDEKAMAVGGVMHCFTEDWEMAKKALDLGFYISFSGIVTFKNAKDLQEVAKKTPLDRMLIETDSPYLTPNPMRGSPNEPAYVRHTAEYIAALRGIPFASLAEVTTHNFFNLFTGAVRPHV